MDEGFLRANAGELFAFLTVFGSAWRILRHPIAYEDHLIRKPKETVRFFVVSAGLATFFAGIFFSAPGAEHTGIKLETIAPLHRLLPGLHIGLQGEDIIPLGMLTWAVAAVLGHLAELGRRHDILTDQRRQNALHAGLLHRKQPEPEVEAEQDPRTAMISKRTQGRLRRWSIDMPDC